MANISRFFWAAATAAISRGSTRLSCYKISLKALSFHCCNTRRMQISTTIVTGNRLSKEVDAGSELERTSMCVGARGASLYVVEPLLSSPHTALSLLRKPERHACVSHRDPQGSGGKRYRKLLLLMATVRPALCHQPGSPLLGTVDTRKWGTPSAVVCGRVMGFYRF